MNDYQRYMDSVTMPETLRKKLTALKTPKKTARWQRYGAMAAAAALVVGLGSWGTLRWRGMAALPSVTERTDLPSVTEPAIAPVTGEPGAAGEWLTPYEIVRDGVASAYMLPALHYANDPGTLADYSLAPPGALRRDVTQEDLLTLVKGTENLTDHLDWPADGEWGGVLWFLSDGTPCGAAIWVTGEDCVISLELLAGAEVPSCVALPEDSYERTVVWDTEVTALKDSSYVILENGTELRESREISLLANGVGCKFTVRCADGEQAERLCSRLARFAILEGFDLSALDSAGAVSE